MARLARSQDDPQVVADYKYSLGGGSASAGLFSHSEGRI